MTADAPSQVKTDYDRWSDQQSLSGEWDDRARFAAQFVPRGLTILDIGCGAMAADQAFAAGDYRPVDVVARDERTRVLDLNETELPLAWLDGVDLVLTLGVLEYLVDPGAFMRRVAKAGRALLCSYSPADRGPPTDRAADGWVNSYTSADLESLAEESGFAIAWRYAYNDQFVYLLAPEQADVSRVSLVRAKTAAELVGRRVTSRPCIVVAGFFGRSNCGDEALAQVIFETFSPSYDVVVSLDEHGASEGYWNLYPYRECHRIHQGDLSFPAWRLEGMIVGGGGLPVGFVADQIFAARSSGTPLALAGTDFPVNFAAEPGLAHSTSAGYLDCFDFVALRSASAVDRARQVGHRAFYGADWAFRLPSDAAPEVTSEPGRVLIVLREFPLRSVAWHYVSEVRRLVDGIRATGRSPVFLPFCPEDDRFLHQLGLTALAPVERHWWNARRTKQIIGASGAVVSVGRLHPMIFAASTRTPVVQLRPPLSPDLDDRLFDKVVSMSAELDVDYLPTVAELIDSIAEGRMRPAGERALRSAETRLDAMIERLRELFRG